MQLSKKMLKISPSGTVILAQKARQLKAEGKDIIELGEGEPDFNTPEFIIRYAYQSAKNGATKYTSVSGTPELKNKITEKLRKENNINYNDNQIVVGAGAKQLIFNALFCSINTGDEVIIPSPYWVSYPEMVKIADGIPIILNCDLKNNFKISLEKLVEVINPKTKWLILNSPGNPSGAVYTWDELLALSQVLINYPQINILCDDIYEKIVFDGKKFHTLAEVAPNLIDRILTVNGFSKSYAMTGWRIGYAAGHFELIEAMIKLQGQSTTNASTIGQEAAIAALDAEQNFLNDWLKMYTIRRDIVSNSLGNSFKDSFNNPEGAFYHFISCEALVGKKFNGINTINNDRDFCQLLLEKYGVAVVPGSEFGTPGYFRLCFAKSEDDLKNACQRINDFLKLLN